MLIFFRQYIVPFLSLFLAIYFLNFSVDIPKIEVKDSIGISEVENLLALVLSVEHDLNPVDINPNDSNKEIEKENTEDSFDIFHYSPPPTIENAFFSSMHSEYAHHFAISGRALDITTPPPKK